MLIRSESTRDLINNPMEFLGMMLLLVTGGTETTRSTISGSVHALNDFPDEYQKIRDNPKLINSMVPEVVRWQTPILSMRRRANEDTIFRGQKICKGDKLLLWYLSGNRDGSVIEDPYTFKVDRKNPRHQISFGFGIHRCMGNRLAEMQLRVMWEEIMKRFRFIEMAGEPTRVRSMMVRGYTDMPVKVHRW
jgi:cytochrome P450